MQRYFSNHQNDCYFDLREDDYYHIKKVMRMKDGEHVQVVYQNVPYLCAVKFVGEEVKIQILNEIEQKKEIIPDVTLFVPILKEQKMDYIFQKATELGVSRFIPVIMERCMVKLDSKEEKKLTRWRRIVKEASEQSMRTSIPIVEEIVPLKNIEEDGLKLICSTVEKENTIKRVFQNHKNCDKMSILIGPEGGLSEQEENWLIEKNFVPITLGPRIMRVETVPLYLMSIINYEYME